MAEQVEKGDYVRITHCPTAHQHDGQTGKLMATEHGIYYVEFPNGLWCFPYTVERLGGKDSSE
jgi:hypothetical protein